MEDKRNVEDCIRHGPWGHSYRDSWDYLPKGFINKITVRHGSIVESIKFQTCCSTCSIGDYPSSFSAGYRKDIICIDYPAEYLVSISGTFGYDDKFGHCVTSICFKTNKNSYGPFGTHNGTEFSYDGNDEVIVGFHGRAIDEAFVSVAKTYHKGLTAIGVYVMPKLLAFVKFSTCQDKSMLQLNSSKPRMVMPRYAGPWGVDGGDWWDDGVFTTIKQVRVHLGELNVIYALQFEYLKRDAKSVMSQIHGETDGTQIELVNLDVKEDEYLIGISGYYGPIEGRDGLEAIASIKFHSNKRIYGPYGRKKSAGYVSYTSSASPGKVVGFHGRSDDFLTAIGVHMEYF